MDMRTRADLRYIIFVIGFITITGGISFLINLGIELIWLFGIFLFILVMFFWKDLLIAVAEKSYRYDT